MDVVFLDRDGVINEFPGNGNYVTKVKSFNFLPGSLEAIRLLSEEGYDIFIISNQAGVGKGVYSKEKLRHITRNMLKGIKAAGGKIKKIYYCTHKSDQDCSCRKPGVGLIEKALKIENGKLDLQHKVFFVGDTKSDILTGYNARCKTILVLSGRAKRMDVYEWGIKPDYIRADLLDAVKFIIKYNSKRFCYTK